MLKRSKIVALSKSALRRAAAGKAGVIPVNKKHVKELKELKEHRDSGRTTAFQQAKRA
jgi:hypothetical protein